MKPPDTPRQNAAVVGWVSAYALYVVAYTAAVRLSMPLGLGVSLLAGFANSLPEAMAAPLVLRAAGGADPRGRSGLRLALMGALFVAWSILGATFGFAVIRLVHEGVWKLAIDPRTVAWKGMLSLLVFGALVGFGLARFHSRQARDASARALRAETLRAESRLAVLRAQLNPHFILNVLHSLVGLAERDPRTTAGALERLGTTLRYALRVQSHGSDRVALRDELAFTREYLELERLRLGDRLETRFAVDEAPLGRIVPSFVLQPLVENAVIHAISPRARGGIVSIRIGEEAGALLLLVEDDGAGAAGDAAAGTGRGEGIGLALLRDRLDALYGNDGTLRIDRSPLGGLRATVRLVGEPAAHEPVEPE